MSTATDAWLHQVDFPAQPAPKDLLEFFGVPPSPEEDLPDNIREKRKIWKGRANRTRAAEGKAVAEAVLQAIDDAENVLLLGATSAGTEVPDFGAASTGAPTSIDDVFAEIERLLFRGRYGEALDRLRAAEDDWGRLSRYRDLRARVILDVVENEPALVRGHGVIQTAISDARKAIDELGADEGRYLILIDLLLAGGERADAERAFREGLSSLDSPSPSFQAKELALLGFVRIDSLIAKAVAIVTSAGDDRAVRSLVVEHLLKRAVGLLPLKSETPAAEYRRLVEAASWAAHGVPAAEADVRPHRMWAASATQKVFAGNWQWRALVAVLTGFVALPLYNLAMSKPAYSVLLAGPSDGTGFGNRARDRAYFMVTRNGYVELVHETTKLPWQSAPGRFVELSNVDALFDF